jgi:hypothetical protein
MARISFSLTALGILAAVPAFAQTITITREGCAALQQYVPAPDVDYRPGVDVDGNAVAPADLNGSPQIKIPDEIAIAITVLLQRKLGIPANPADYKPEAYIGTVVVKPDGRVYFNNQPLQDDAAFELAQLCQKQGGAPNPPPGKR